MRALLAAMTIVVAAVADCNIQSVAVGPQGGEAAQGMAAHSTAILNLQGGEAAQGSMAAQATAILNLARVTSDGRYCISFSPFPAGYSPPAYGGEAPPPSLVAELLDRVLAAGRVKCVFTYGATVGNEHVPAAAAARGLPVIQGIYVGPDAGVNAREVASALALAAAYPRTVLGLVCGHEVRLRWDAGLAAVRVPECLAAVRAGGARVPVGHAATWPEACDEDYSGGAQCGRRWAPIATSLDFLLVHSYAFFENRVSMPARFPCLPPGAAAAHHVDRLRAVAAVFAPLPVMLGEFGWPGPPTPLRDPLGDAKCAALGDSVASRDAQYFVAVDTLRACRDAGEYACIPFTAVREPWKERVEGALGPWLGFCDPQPPYACDLPAL